MSEGKEGLTITAAVTFMPLLQFLEAVLLGQVAEVPLLTCLLGTTMNTLTRGKEGTPGWISLQCDLL